MYTLPHLNVLLSYFQGLKYSQVGGGKGTGEKELLFVIKWQYIK
jgi:hypothetical protein